MKTESDDDSQFLQSRNDAKSLTEIYRFTLSNRDVTILNKLLKLDPKLDCLIFRQKAADENTLNKQAKLADFVSLKLNETVLASSIQNYPLSRKIDEIDRFYGTRESKVYDPVYLLPNLYNLLDYANIVDVLQFVQGRLLSFLFASLSSECAKLRSLSYACIYRFVSHLESLSDFVGFDLQKIITLNFFRVFCEIYPIKKFIYFFSRQQSLF